MKDTDGIRYIGRFDKEYPQRLQDIKNPPAGIYVKGNLPKEDCKTVAIVGARECSEYGKMVAIEFSRVLAWSGVQIVSGMAKGVDGISQKAAMEAGGTTYGVLGCGVNVVYPKENSRLFEEILLNGGLISEFEPDAKPLAKQFPSRNRIISGLADVILVVESRLRSGTSITVGHALEQGKEVFAVPGRIGDSLSEGCNLLIQQGSGVALAPADLLEELGITMMEKEGNKSKKIILLEKTEKVLYSCLDFYPKNLDEIAGALKIEIPDILEALLSLELKGYIKEQGKNNYIKLQ